MKVILTVTIVILLGGVTGSCSLDNKQQVRGSNSATPSPTGPDGEGLPTPSYNEMLRHVAELSKQAGIANLKGTTLPDGQTEIRIWKGFGYQIAHGLLHGVADSVQATSM